MQLDKIALADTHAFIPFFLDYIEQKDSLKPYYNRFPLLENFAGQIAEKSLFPAENREVVATALQDQYDGFQLSARVAENILLLKNKTTFTVTTGHQLNIFT
ncbi:MAG TPA: bacillithiol biosynthesis BshC, partial [Saprospiraceae bacterium]|nr:bacillithiol biosynthesis BshC [Saprospiraceae bacterium]